MKTFWILVQTFKRLWLRLREWTPFVLLSLRKPKTSMSSKRHLIWMSVHLTMSKTLESPCNIAQSYGDHCMSGDTF